MLTYPSNARVRATQACGVMLVACALLAQAQAPEAPPASGNPAPPAKGRVLNIRALDTKGRPVTDLTRAELKLFDDGKAQPIVSFNSSPAQSPGMYGPPATLVLFDLLNLIPGQRTYLTSRIVRFLEPLEQGDSVYLYLLTNRGDLYPVRALPEPQTAISAPSQATAGDLASANAPWTRQVRPLLDQAIQKVYGFRPWDYHDIGMRSAATFRALSDLGDQFMKIPGPKAIVWISQGASYWVSYPYGCRDVTFPEGSGSYLAARCGYDCDRRPGISKCLDYTPFLQHFGAKLTQSDTVFYGVEMNSEGMITVAPRGWPRDTLQKLADLSGGRLYLNGEVDKAVAESFEVRVAYQLSYEAPPPNGKFHELRVTCSRKGVRIVAPQGYFAELPRSTANPVS